MVSLKIDCNAFNSFEIKCLSKKYRVNVNGEAYYFKDEAIPLLSRSIVSISSETFFFLLPPSASNTNGANPVGPINAASGALALKKQQASILSGGQ